MRRGKTGCWMQENKNLSVLVIVYGHIMISEDYLESLLGTSFQNIKYTLTVNKKLYRNFRESTSLFSLTGSPACSFGAKTLLRPFFLKFEEKNI